MKINCERIGGHRQIQTDLSLVTEAVQMNPGRTRTKAFLSICILFSTKSAGVRISSDIM